MSSPSPSALEATACDAARAASEFAQAQLASLWGQGLLLPGQAPWQQPGQPGGCPPGFPQIRTCPIKASGSSSHSFAFPLCYPLALR